MWFTCRMTRTEAAETIALHVVVWSRKTGQPVTKTMVEEILSEYRGGHRGEFLQQTARLASVPTTLRLARKGL